MAKALTFEERHARLGSEPLWGREEAAMWLGISLRSLDSLPIPRAEIAGRVRYVPDQVRLWAESRLSYRLTPAA
jgi:hypothetical protein